MYRGVRGPFAQRLHLPAPRGGGELELVSLLLLDRGERLGVADCVRQRHEVRQLLELRRIVREEVCKITDFAGERKNKKERATHGEAGVVGRAGCRRGQQR